jgi:17beta-estradiol 17-dehydrogenase / very-long-chain 3-oxoacyl-CoA reductase
MRLIKKYIHPILLYVILTIFFIEIFLLLIQMCQGFYKYFLISELNLIKRYGKNSWVIITGASSGQGRDFALEFSKRGFNILMIGSKRTYNTEQEIKKMYPSVQTQVIVKDFRKAFDDNFFDDIQIAFNNLGARIAVLINNVGYRTAWKQYHKMPSELIKDTIAIGTMVQSRLIHMVIPHFLERLDKYKLKSGLINITAQCLHPNFLFGLTLSNEISLPYLSVYEAANAFGFYQGNSIYKEYQNKFDILNITPGAVVTKNTQYLKNTFFSVNSDIYVKNIIKMIGNIQGHTCAYWGHGFSNFLINLGPFMKDKLLKDVGNNIAKNFMSDYQKDREKYKV